MESRTRGSIEMTVAMVILGTIGWFVVMSGLPAVAVVFWRCLFGAVVLLAICAALGLFRRRLTPDQTGLAIVGGVAMVLNWVLLFAAFNHASISMATAVYNTQPFMLVALGTIFLAERLNVRKVAWLVIGFVGMLLVIAAGPSIDASGSNSYLGGILMALGAALFWAIAALTAKKLAGTPPQLVALVHVTVGTLMLAPFQDVHSMPSNLQAWELVLAVGVVHTGLVYILMYSAIQRLSTTRQAALTFIYPIVATLVDVVAFDQRFTLAQVGGAVAILVAAAGMNLGWSIPGLARFDRTGKAFG